MGGDGKFNLLERKRLRLARIIGTLCSTTTPQCTDRTGCPSIFTCAAPPFDNSLAFLRFPTDFSSSFPLYFSLPPPFPPNYTITIVRAGFPSFSFSPASETLHSLASQTTHKKKQDFGFYNFVFTTARINASTRQNRNSVCAAYSASVLALAS